MKILSNRTIWKILFLCILSILFNLFSCATKNMDNSKNIISYKLPVNKNDGWDISSLNKEGIKENLIIDLLNKINNKNYKNIHSLIIIRNNKIVLDENFKNKKTYVDNWVGNKDIKLHAAMSATKSIFSLLMGIAIDKKIINSVDDKVWSFFPEYKSFKNWENRKNNITIKNFLTMCHGLYWDETSYAYNDSRNSFSDLENSYDWVKHTLDLKLNNEPGTVFAYSSAISHTTGAIITKASGKTLPEFAEEFLFGPLGIKKKIWMKAPNERADDIYLTSRALTKIGQLILNKGSWKGKQIVSENWILESTQTRTNFQDFGYAYFWWKYTFSINDIYLESIIAWGFGGQFIFIFPQINTVIVFTSGNYNNTSLEEQPFEMLKEYILPAMIIK